MTYGTYDPSAAVPEVVDVSGGHELCGTVQTGGFKHSLVTCVAAACLGSAPIRVDNCPDITETMVLGRILRGLGAGVTVNGSSLTVDPARMMRQDLDSADVASIHGAVYLAPALLARFGVVQMPAGGGCRIGQGSGARPISQYLSVLSRFGADVQLLNGDGFIASATRLRATEIDLLDYTSDRSLKTGPLYSGATKFATLAAASAQGASVLRNPYPKPDVRDLAALLAAMGADIQTRPDDTLIITGGLDRLRRPAAFSLSPDLIEVMTWLAAGIALSPKGIVISGQGMKRSLTGLAPELSVLRAMGVEIGPVDDTSVTVRQHQHLRPVDVLAALTRALPHHQGADVRLRGLAVVGGLPFCAVLSLPILFAAGMCPFDTADGCLVNLAYDWAFAQPVRKVFYNLIITGLSVFVAFFIGTIEILGLISQEAKPVRRILVLHRQPQHQRRRVRHRRRLRPHLDRRPVHLALRQDRGEMGPARRRGQGKRAGD
jgi:UDP-N-acetylglucosamine enolpyruvyl transferase